MHPFQTWSLDCAELMNCACMSEWGYYFIITPLTSATPTVSHYCYSRMLPQLIRSIIFGLQLLS